VGPIKRHYQGALTPKAKRLRGWDVVSDCGGFMPLRLVIAQRKGVAMELKEALRPNHRAAVNAYTAIWDAIKLPDFAEAGDLLTVRWKLYEESLRTPEDPTTPAVNASNALLRAYMDYLGAVILEKQRKG
jgi:hypothetical protein